MKKLITLLFIFYSEVAFSNPIIANLDADLIKVVQTQKGIIEAVFKTKLERISNFKIDASNFPSELTLINNESCKIIEPGSDCKITIQYNPAIVNSSPNSLQLNFSYLDANNNQIADSINFMYQGISREKWLSATSSSSRFLQNGLNSTDKTIYSYGNSPNGVDSFIYAINTDTGIFTTLFNSSGNVYVVDALFNLNKKTIYAAEYASENSGILVAIDSKIGALKWPSSAPIIGGGFSFKNMIFDSNNRLYIRNEKYVNKISNTNGVILWSYPNSSNSDLSLNISPDNKMIYLTTNDVISSLYSENYSLIWRLQIPRQQPSSNTTLSFLLSPDGNTIYAYYKDENKFYAIDPTIPNLIEYLNNYGSIKWISQPLQPAGETIYSFLLSPDGGTVYNVLGHGNIDAFDANTGIIKWISAPLDGTSILNSFMFNHDKKTAILSDSQKIYSLNLTNGTINWVSQPTQPATGASINVTRSKFSSDGETLYVVAEDNKLYALESATGLVRWISLPIVSSATSIEVSPDNNSIYVVGTNRSVYSFNESVIKIKN